MSKTSVIEETIQFASGPNTLCGVLAYPSEGSPACAVLLCSPHPHFAGDMDNNVIKTVARALAERGVSLRFDYRGIGSSQIQLPEGVSVFDYWDEVEQTKSYDDATSDITAALNTLIETVGSDVPVFCVGYSFGTITGMQVGTCQPEVAAVVGIAPPFGKVSLDFLKACDTPTYWIVGSQDFLYQDQAFEGLKELIGEHARFDLWEDVDHFFRGDEDRIARAVTQFIVQYCPLLPEEFSDVRS
ncbi:MAG: alpha/beta hydrolase [Phycisphaeraceae bacterium]|nr:alpha/beta hydrolase [Phycisphaeraceae bacterium]